MPDLRNSLVNKDMLLRVNMNDTVSPIKLWNRRTTFKSKTGASRLPIPEFL